jgi:hypothetical protein
MIRARAHKNRFCECVLVNVRFAPNATELMRGNEWTRRATTGRARDTAEQRVLAISVFLKRRPVPTVHRHCCARAKLEGGKTLFERVCIRDRYRLLAHGNRGRYDLIQYSDDVFVAVVGNSSALLKECARIPFLVD